MTVHGALRAYLQKHPVIAPKREGRAVALDLPGSVLSQDAIFGEEKPYRYARVPNDSTRLRRMPR